MTTKVEATPGSERELVLARIIDAPREKVFRAWTDPALLKQWFAPYTARVRHWTVADREAHEKMGFHEGWSRCGEQLEALVGRL
jgi:uncharacterized protein YndB with AHSA1/START domain